MVGNFFFILFFTKNVAIRVDNLDLIRYIIDIETMWASPMKRPIMIINDALWIVTAILCIFYEHPAITLIVCITTIIYAIDLFIKFKAMRFNVAQFIKAYWLDILFLIPICKLFRGFRIFKVGRMLRVMDATFDFTEIVFRVKNGIQNFLAKRKH